MIQRRTTVAGKPAHSHVARVTAAGHGLTSRAGEGEHCHPIGAGVVSEVLGHVHELAVQVPSDLCALCYGTGCCYCLDGAPS